MKISNRHYLHLLPNYYIRFQFTRDRDRPNLVGILSADFGLLSRWFAHSGFGLGRGPITPPGPAMALTGRKDLNSTKPKPNQPWFGVSRGEESESPGVVTKRQESESESESIKLPRLRLWLRLVYNSLARFGVGQNNFSETFS